MYKELAAIRENIMRFDELKEYLIGNGYPLEVHVFEDGTRIVDKIEYFSEFNTLIGHVAPFDNITGMPVVNYDFANTSKNIHHSITNFGQN